MENQYTMLLPALAEFCVAGSVSDLRPDERGQLEQHLFDSVVAYIAGSFTAEGRRHMKARHGPSDAVSSLYGPSWCDEVALRCAILRSTEVDDIHLAACVTPGSVVVPVVLTLAARLGPSAAPQIAPSLYVGYELMTRLGRSIGGPAMLSNGLWPSCFAAPFAAAAAASRLLGLDVQKTAHALSIALVGSAGRISVTGGHQPARWLVYGQAARLGCLAALAARAGYQGNPKLLDGGWMRAQFPETWDPRHLVQERAAQTCLSGLRFKPFCTAMQLMSAISALRNLLGTGIEPAQIEQIELAVPPRTAAMVDHGVDAADRLSSITSAPYQLALAAVQPCALYDIDRSEIQIGPELALLMEKVRTIGDPSLLVHYPENWPARVTITTAHAQRSGLVLSAAVCDEDLAYKWRRLLAPVLGEEEAARWLRESVGAMDEPGLAWSICQRFAGHATANV